jgi:hypothetical protein
MKKYLNSKKMWVKPAIETLAFNATEGSKGSSNNEAPGNPRQQRAS